MSPTIMSLTELFIDINGELSLHNRKQLLTILKWLQHKKYKNNQSVKSSLTVVATYITVFCFSFFFFAW